VLGQLDLSEIAGGLPTTTTLSVAETRCVCPSVHIVCNTTPNLDSCSLIAVKSRARSKVGYRSD